MHFSYILHNKDGRGRRVPRGQAWQWIHEVEGIENLGPILEWIDLRVAIDQLHLLNVYLDHTEITSPKNACISFECKAQVVYSHVTVPDRIIEMNSIAVEPFRKH